MTIGHLKGNAAQRRKHFRHLRRTFPPTFDLQRINALRHHQNSNTPKLGTKVRVTP